MPAIRGMIFRVKHMVEVEEINGLRRAYPMKLHELQPAAGSTTAAEAPWPRHGLRPGQDLR